MRKWVQTPPKHPQDQSKKGLGTCLGPVHQTLLQKAPKSWGKQGRGPNRRDLLGKWGFTHLHHHSLKPAWGTAFPGLSRWFQEASNPWHAPRWCSGYFYGHTPESASQNLRNLKYENQQFLGLLCTIGENAAKWYLASIYKGNQRFLKLQFLYFIGMDWLWKETQNWQNFLLGYQSWEENFILSYSGPVFELW